MKLDEGWRNESQIVSPTTTKKKNVALYISFAGWTACSKLVLDKSDLKTIPGLSLGIGGWIQTRGHRRGYRLSLRKPKKRKFMLISNLAWILLVINDTPILFLIIIIFFTFFGSGTGLASKIRKAKKAASMLFVKNSTNCPVLAGEGKKKSRPWKETPRLQTLRQGLPLPPRSPAPSALQAPPRPLLIGQSGKEGFGAWAGGKVALVTHPCVNAWRSQSWRQAVWSCELDQHSWRGRDTAGQREQIPQQKIGLWEKYLNKNSSNKSLNDILS